MECNGWMDGWMDIEWMDDLQFYILFSSISVISGWWADDYERLCAMKSCLWLKRSHLMLGLNSGLLDQTRPALNLSWAAPLKFANPSAKTGNFNFQMEMDLPIYYKVWLCNSQDKNSTHLSTNAMFVSSNKVRQFWNCQKHSHTDQSHFIFLIFFFSKRVCWLITWHYAWLRATHFQARITL